MEGNTTKNTTLHDLSNKNIKISESNLKYEDDGIHKDIIKAWNETQKIQENIQINENKIYE